MEDANVKIDQLAKNGKLDPAMMLTMTKAYAAAKDTDYTKEQVKDVMAHLYHKVSVFACHHTDVHTLINLTSISVTQGRQAGIPANFAMHEDCKQ